MNTALKPSNIAATLEPIKGQLAALTRILNKEGILSYSGHAAVRVPGADALIIHGINDSRAGVTPEHMGIVDFDMNVLEGPRGYKPPRETFIHSEIFRARPDVNACVHIHSDTCATFTMVAGVELALMKSHAVRWRQGIPVHADPSHIKSPAQGSAIAKTLGAGFGALIRAHGGVLVAESIPALLVDAVHFDENAKACLAAAAIGKIKPLTQAELELLAENNDNRGQHVYKLWSYYVGKAIEDGVVPGDWEGLVQEAVD
jgi:ribulose-5-phosphate 4-epimerase/fuculose-1-phosphate aldolase